MKIALFDTNAFTSLPYQSIQRGGLMKPAQFPLHRGQFEKDLDGGLIAIFALSDLQGHDVTAHNPRLLGPALVDRFVELADGGLIPDPKQSIVLLCGDLFALRTRRGGTGEIRPVINAFAAAFHTVLVVLGNHDLLQHCRALNNGIAKNARILDGGVVHVGGISIGGLSGVIGKPGKANRRPESEQIASLEHLLAQSPDILMLHEGPSDPDTGLEGHIGIRRSLVDSRFGGVVLCGHPHWDEPLKMVGGVQVVNLDHRGAIFENQRAGSGTAVCRSLTSSPRTNS